MSLTSKKKDDTKCSSDQKVQSDGTLFLPFPDSNNLYTIGVNVPHNYVTLNIPKAEAMNVLK
jgi:hypothetical protein